MSKIQKLINNLGVALCDESELEEIYILDMYEQSEVQVYE